MARRVFRQVTQHDGESVLPKQWESLREVDDVGVSPLQDLAERHGFRRAQVGDRSALERAQSEAVVLREDVDQDLYAVLSGPAILHLPFEDQIEPDRLFACMTERSIRADRR